MTSTQKLTDLELVENFRKGDDLALDELIHRYTPLIWNTTKKFFLHMGNRDDLIQWGKIGVWQAALNFKPLLNDTYDPDKGFPKFVKLIVTRKMATAVESDRSKKHKLMDGFSELTEYVDSVSPHPEVKFLMIEIVKTLTPLELSSLHGVIAGYSYDEIADQLGCRKKSVDNAVQRVRKKVKNILNSPDEE